MVFDASETKWFKCKKGEHPFLDVLFLVFREKSFIGKCEKTHFPEEW